MPRSRAARPIEKSTAFPSPPPHSTTVSFSGRWVGAPVGPMTTTGSPSFSKAQSRLETPISRAIIERRPFSLSTHAPVRAHGSMRAGAPGPPFASGSRAAKAS